MIPTIFSIVNVTAIANLHQIVDITKLTDIKFCTYDRTKYQGKCAYVKLPKMNGKVSVFATGVMISVGANSTKSSLTALKNTKNFLKKNKLIKSVKIQPKIVNIVALLNLNYKIDIEELSLKLNGSFYEPAQFPALRYKIPHVGSFNIFASGKIIITGTKSDMELSRAIFEIRQKLESVENIRG